MNWMMDKRSIQFKPLRVQNESVPNFRPAECALGYYGRVFVYLEAAGLKV